MNQSVDQPIIHQILHKLNEMHLLLIIEKGSELSNGTSKNYFTNNEVSKLLNISSRTLQTYRDTGAIEFVQRGKKIYYTKQAIEDFMTANTIKKFNTKNK